MRPGVAERLGIGFEQAREANPEVVYLQAPGWGSSGPDADRQSFAPKHAAYAGAAHENSGRGNPPFPPIPTEDNGNGLLGAIGMLIGVVNQKLGEDTATYLECPQLHAAMAELGYIVREVGGDVIGAGRLDHEQNGVGPLERLFEVDDGWVCVHAVTDEAMAGVGEVIGVDLLGDARFESADAREEHAGVLQDLIEKAFGSWKADELVEALREAGVPAVVPVLDNMEGFLRNSYNLEIGRVARSEHPAKGTIYEQGRLIRATDVNAVSHRPAPLLGEHSAEILSELGYSQQEIDEMFDDSVIKSETVD